MRVKKNNDLLENPQLVCIDRWTVDRLDKDAGMARIESAPMRSDRISKILLGKLLEKGLDTGMDQLSLWNNRQTRIRRMPLKSLARMLGVRRDERETLSENMVFWVLRYRDKKEPERIFHATQAARETAKDLYFKVAHSAGGDSHEI